MGLKTMNLKGKEYVTVNVRVQEFRSNDLYKGYSLDTDILSETEDKITMKATIRDVEGRVIASGIATEYFTDKNPKATENCETSAWGRALGNLGIGIDEAIASSQEMESYDRAMTHTPKQFTPKQSMQSPGEDTTCPQCNQAATKLTGKYGPYIKCLNCNKNFKTV